MSLLGDKRLALKVALLVEGVRICHQSRPPVTVSGHANQEEIKPIYALTKPKYAIPVHGEYRHLIRYAEIAQMMGVPKDNIFHLSSGDVLTISEDKAAVTDEVTAQGILVDGLGVGDIGNVVLRNRQMLSRAQPKSRFRWLVYYLWL